MVAHRSYHDSLTWPNSVATAIELRDGHLTQTGQIHLLSEEFGSKRKEFKKRIHLRNGFQNYLIRARIHFFPNVCQRKIILDIITWQHDKHVPFCCLQQCLKPLYSCLKEYFNNSTLLIWQQFVQSIIFNVIEQKRKKQIQDLNNPESYPWTALEARVPGS